MKKYLIAFGIAALALTSCSTTKLVGVEAGYGIPAVSLKDNSLCVSWAASAKVNADSLVSLMRAGYILKTDNLEVIVWLDSTNTLRLGSEACVKVK